MSFQATIQDWTEKIKDSAGQGKGAVLILGEVCAEIAGLPSEDHFIEIIKATYPEAYEKAKTKDLAGCAQGLSPRERKDLLNDQVRKARTHWTHLCAALLLKEGLVSRVMTLSPDSLVLRASAMVGDYPATYDCAATTFSKPDLASAGAVYFVNGRGLGQSPANADSIFADISKEGPVIVLGSQGADGNVLTTQLAKAAAFENGMLWVLPNGDAPGKNLSDILGKDNAETAQCPDPDAFMVALCQGLGVLPPEFVQFPFSHVGQLLKSIAPLPVPGSDNGLNLAEIPLFNIKQAILQYEGEDRGKDISGGSPGGVDNPDLLNVIQEARAALVTGELEKILSFKEQYEQTPAEPLGDLLYLAYISQGDKYLDQAAEKEGEDAFDLLKQAGERYHGAIEISPDSHGILVKLGKLLVEQAKLKDGEEAEALFSQAGEKYQKAIELQPDLLEANYGWGFVLLEQAGTKTEEEAEALFSQAIEKFQEVLKKDPGHGDAAFGAGYALFVQARKKKGAEALRLYGQAAEKLNTALKVDPNNAEALLHMGQALLIFSKSKKGEELDRMLAAAAEKFQSCVKLRPNLPEAFFGWADALLERGLARDDEQGETLCSQAMEKFQTVLALRPDMPRVNFRWGVGLMKMAKRQTGEIKLKLLNQAAEKFQNAIRIVPSNYEAFTRLGNVFLQLAHGKTGLEADALLSQAVEKYEQSIKVHPNNPEAYTNWGSVFFQLAAEKKGVEADAFLYKAIEKFQEALKIKADYLRAISNWGNALFKLGKSKGGEEGEMLLAQAEEKYQSAIKIKPDDPLALTNFGGILIKKARDAKPEEAEKQIERAQELLELALKFGEDNADALSYLGEALMTLAKNKKGINAHPLLADAKAKLLKAEELQSGVATYNMAKLMAQLANESGCKEWLEKCKANETLPDQAALESEPVFTTMSQSKWFKKLWAPPGEPAKEGEEKEEEGKDDKKKGKEEKSAK